MKKVLSLLLTVMMLVSLVTVSVSAAAGNVSFKFDKETYAPGETITITLASKEKIVKMDGFNIEYDNTKVEFVAIKTPTGTSPITRPGQLKLTIEWGEDDTESAGFSIAEHNAAGAKVAFTSINEANDTKLLAEDPFAKVEFVVKAGATGDIVFKLNEQSSGTNGFKGVSDTKTVTVPGATQPEVKVEAKVTTGTERAWDVTAAATLWNAGSSYTAELYNSAETAWDDAQTLAKGFDGVFEAGAADVTVTVKTKLNSDIGNVLGLKFTINGKSGSVGCPQA